MKNFKKLINNLHILNSIKIGDKLVIFNGNLKINEESIFRPFYRMIFNQNREKVCIFVINLIESLNEELGKFYSYKTNRLKEFKSNQSEINIKSLESYNNILFEYKKIKDTIEIISYPYSQDIQYFKKILLLKELII